MGVQACALVLEVATRPQKAVYVGTYSGWVADTDEVVEKVHPALAEELEVVQVEVHTVPAARDGAPTLVSRVHLASQGRRHRLTRAPTWALGPRVSLPPTWAYRLGVRFPPTWARRLAVRFPPTWALGLRVSLRPTWALRLAVIGRRVRDNPAVALRRLDHLRPHVHTLAAGLLLAVPAPLADHHLDLIVRPPRVGAALGARGQQRPRHEPSSSVSGTATRVTSRPADRVTRPR